jgi:ABC-2 type transport system ATP-binding protein
MERGRLVVAGPIAEIGARLEAQRHAASIGHAGPGQPMPAQQVAAGPPAAGPPVAGPLVAAAGRAARCHPVHTRRPIPVLTYGPRPPGPTGMAGRRPSRASRDVR